MQMTWWLNLLLFRGPVAVLQVNHWLCGVFCRLQVGLQVQQLPFDNQIEKWPALFGALKCIGDVHFYIFI